MFRAKQRTLIPLAMRLVGVVTALLFAYDSRTFFALSLSQNPQLESVQYVKQHIRVYKNIAKTNKRNITTMLQYGDALMKLGRYEKAEKAFWRAYKLNPLSSRAIDSLYMLNLQRNIELNETQQFPGLSLPPLLYQTREISKGIPNAFYHLAEKKGQDSATGSRASFAPKVVGTQQVRLTQRLEMTLEDENAFHNYVLNGNFSSSYWEKSPLLIHLGKACTICSQITFKSILGDASKSGYKYSSDRANESPYRNVNYLKKSFVNRMESTRPTHYAKDIVRALKFGYTLQFLGIHRYDRHAARFALKLSRSSTRPVNINMYITPPNVDRSLNAHTDFQGSFMVQLNGKKRWQLWMYDELLLPVRHRHIRGRDRGDEVLISDLGEPFLDVTLEPGDILFVPRGCLHATSTPSTIHEKLNAKPSIATQSFPAQCPFKPKRDDSATGNKVRAGSLIEDHGSWLLTENLIRQAHTEFDTGFGESLDGFLQGESLIDLGAGVGQLGVFLKRMNSTVEWYGFDGSSNIEKYVGKSINRFSKRKRYVVPNMCWIDMTKNIDFAGNNLVNRSTYS